MKEPKGGETDIWDQGKYNFSEKHRVTVINQNLILPSVAILLVGLGWYLIWYQTQILIEATVLTYQHTQLEITRALARSVKSYVVEQINIDGRTDVAEIEQEIFKQFIAPVRLLENGDAWIYAPNHVVFDLSSDFPEEYRGKNMAEIFALQSQHGASHYEEMTEAVMKAREGVGWYIWLPDKGQEIAAWTPVPIGELVWVIGLSTPLPEILESTGAQGRIWSSYVSMGLVTLVVLALLVVWNNGRRQRDRGEVERERLLFVEQEQRLLAETLAQAFLALTSQTDQTKVLDEILNQVQHIVPYDAANIVLIEDEVLHLARWQGYQPTDHENLLSHLRQPLASFPLDAEVMRSQQSVVVANVKLDPRWVTTEISAWVRSFMAVPISLHNQVIGLLRLDSSTPHRFSPRDISRIQPLTHAAAIALENARLYSQLRKELLERTQAEQKALELNGHLLIVQFTGAAIASSLDLNYILDKVTVEIAHLLGVESCAIYDWNQVAHTISMVALFELNGRSVTRELSGSYSLTDFPLSQLVLTEKRAQQITLSQPDPDPAELAYMKAHQFKTMLLLPMEAQSEVVGLLEITDSRAERTFMVDEIALTQQLTNQAASALKNARLYAEINRHLEEQTALQEAITIISSTLDLNTVLNHIVDQMGRIVDATSAYICSYEAETMTSTVLAEYLGPRAVDQEKISDLGVAYPLPRDFTHKFQDLLAGQPELIHLDDPEVDESQKSHMRQFGVQTILNIPLRVKNQIIAFAELWESRQERTFTLEEMTLFQSIAQQAAVALDNARLYDQATKEIAERRKVEKELRESETKFRILAETTAAAIFIYQQHRNRYVNPAAAAITGYTQAELLAMNFWEVIHPDFREMVKKRGKARLKDETIPARYELKILTKQNEEQWLDVTLGVIRFEGEAAVLGTAFDITGRKQTEESLRKSEANLKAIFDNSRQAFILIDKDSSIQAFNKIADYGTKLTLGRELREGHSIYEYTVLQELDEHKRNFDRALQSQSVRAERKYLVNDVEKWYEFSYNPVFADDGQVIGVCFSTFDITERKKLIETLAENEKRLLAEIQAVLDITQALVSEINLNSLLEFIINQAKHLLNADGVAVLFLSEDGQYLEVATPSESWLLISPGSRLLVGGSLAEQAIITRQTQTSNHVLGDDRAASMLTLLESAQVSSLMCAPLLIQNKNLGVLMIWSKHEQVFDTQDSRLMNLFANQAALALHNAHLHARNSQLAVEQERHRLARELHDSVTQSLYSIGMAAETALRLLDRKTQKNIHKPVLYIHQLAQIALKEIRDQVHNLHPMAFAEKTLAELLETHCNLLREQYALAVELMADTDLKLSIYQRENLYYLAKEALWNVVKHARGAHVYVSITQAANLMTLSIVDNGSGFVTAANMEIEMDGLRSMRERAALLGASFKLDSKPGQGTQITVQIPVN